VAVTVNEPYKTVDKFDAAFGSLYGKPDTTATPPSTKQVITSFIQGTQSFTVQTIRQRDEGDTIFVQYLDSAGSFRMVIPPAVADLIARQRDALSTKNRRRAAKEEAARRKAAGVVPGFLKKGKARKKKGGEAP
jgi:hypothetical protein